MTCKDENAWEIRQGKQVLKKDDKEDQMNTMGGG